METNFLIKTEAGEYLTRQQVIDRLCQYDVCMIMRNINEEDYSWLSEIRELKFRGYANYTDEELKAEWLNSEDGYNRKIGNKLTT